MSGCHVYSEAEVNTIIYTKIGVATLSFVACLGTLILMCLLMCWLRAWDTLVDRLKLYLTFVAMVLSIMYIFQVLPVKSHTTVNGTATVARSEDWNRACKGIGFLLQYTNWVLLLMIGWMIVFLLWCAYTLGKSQSTTESKWRMLLDVAAIASSLVFPLLFLWMPFVTDSYGLGGQWCGIIVKKGRECNEHGSLLPGLGYQIGLWYGPAIMVALACTVGLVIVTYQFWVYYRRNGLTDEMTRSIIKAIPPATYLVIYNAISCINCSSIIYHNVKSSNEVNYRLYVTHAVTGPCRALAIPIAFVLSHIILQCCYRKRKYRHVH